MILISFLDGIFPILVINKSLLIFVESGHNSSALITVEPLASSLTYLTFTFFLRPTKPFIFSHQFLLQCHQRLDKDLLEI